MPHNGSLTFKVAGKYDFAIPIRVLLGLALLAAVLSPRPVLTLCIMILVCAAGRGVYILRFSKVNAGNLTLVVFPDGQIRLESSNNEVTGGILEGQQWSTRYVAILRVKLAEGTRYLPILSGQQHADDYRRLLMWLRQEFCRGASDTRVSGV